MPRERKILPTVLHKVTQLIPRCPGRGRDVPAAEPAAGSPRTGTPRAQRGATPRDRASPAPHRSQQLRTAALAAARLSPAHSAFALKKKKKQSAPGPLPPVAGGGMRFAGSCRPDSARVSCFGRTWHRPPRRPASAPHLNHVVVEVLGISVDQVDLFGVHVVHRLFAQLVCHHLVVGLVDVALLPDGRRVQKALRGAEGHGGRGEPGRGGEGRAGQGRAGPVRAAQEGGLGRRPRVPRAAGSRLRGGPARLFNRGRGRSPHPRRARRRLRLPPPGGRGPVALPRGGASGPSALGVGAGEVPRARHGPSGAPGTPPSPHRPPHAALALPLPLR